MGVLQGTRCGGSNAGPGTEGPGGTEFKRRERYRKMAVRIRLTRMGSKKKPFYRIIAADSEAPRDGKFLEILGYYDPMKEPRVIEIHEDKVASLAEQRGDGFRLSQGPPEKERIAEIPVRAGMRRSELITSGR